MASTMTTICTIRVQDAGSHGDSMLGEGEGVGKIRRELEPSEVVATCDHLGPRLRSQFATSSLGGIGRCQVPF
jgi:hypothetical protein